MMNDFNPDEQLQPLNLTWSDSLHNYIGDLNTASSYLSFHENKDGEWEWTYCCTTSDEVDEDVLFTLEQAVVSYVRWSAKQLEPENFIEEDSEEDEQNFLNFLDKDIESTTQPLSEELVNKAIELTKGIEVDLDEDYLDLGHDTEEITWLL